MLYISTRDKNVKVNASDAIAMGISKDGGLFVPERIPQLTLDQINSLVDKSYIERAKAILSLYLTDFTEEEIDYCVSNAYKEGKFSSEKVAPIVNLENNVNILELWKGPTCAFKDMALQLLPYLLTVASSKSVKDMSIIILVATSGDTGKAALEGFKDVPNTKILVFYPNDGVSLVQKLQMATQEGENVAVCAINGNFDDAQSGVKSIFTDKEIAKKLAENKMMFSSANSINWGRLVPQIVYYVSAYCDMLKNRKISLGDKINIAVPTGNFGNILAAYYAKKMGVPIDRLICASNSNKVLTDFITSGEYNKNRDFYTTISPSMDILISSNLERLLFELSGQNDNLIKELMSKLSSDGKYNVTDEIKDSINNAFAAGFCTEEQTKETIKNVWENKKYLCDTHTAVAVNVYYDYLNDTGDNKPVVIASTASPFKFSGSVLTSIEGEEARKEDEFAMLQDLSSKTGMQIPSQLAELKNKEVRFKEVTEKDKESMQNTVFKMLDIK